MGGTSIIVFLSDLVCGTRVLHFCIVKDSGELLVSIIRHKSYLSNDIRHLLQVTLNQVYLIEPRVIHFFFERTGMATSFSCKASDTASARFETFSLAKMELT